MAKQPQPYRQLALAKALARGERKVDIAYAFSKAWKVHPRSVFKMLEKLVEKWLVPPKAYSVSSSKAWQTPTPETARRIQVLQESLQAGISRSETVHRYAQEWKLSPNYVSQLIVKAGRPEIEQELAEARVKWMAHVKAKLARAISSGDLGTASKTFQQLAMEMA